MINTLTKGWNMSIQFTDLDHFKKWSDERKLWHKLKDQLCCLSSRGKVKIFPDFAPQSFQFHVFRDEEFQFNGGLIYCGPDQPGDGSFPALTVDISGDHIPHWGIHT